MKSNMISMRRWAASAVAVSFLSLPFACTMGTVDESEAELVEEPVVEAPEALIPLDGVCGDGWCDSGSGESCWTCETDCGPCPDCGDGWCNGSETCFTCQYDCCPPCGDGICSGSETSATCVADCGKYYLDMLSITSVHKDDAAGADEPRLYVAGELFWEHNNFSKGQTLSLAYKADKLFTDNISVQLNEYDGFPEWSTKTLGTFTVYRSTVPLNVEIEETITNNNCSALGYCYKIKYKVYLQ